LQIVYKLIQIATFVVLLKNVQLYKKRNKLNDIDFTDIRKRIKN
jgi:hypothetical protein